MENQNENATVSDVTARMREEASILSLLNGQRVGVASVVNKLREFADSIDAASQRVASKMHALQLELWQGKKMGEFAFALALDGFASALSATTSPAPTTPAKSKAEMPRMKEQEGGAE